MGNIPGCPRVFDDFPNDDNRGTINIWGGIIQNHRGYVVRNSPGPYINNLGGDIGYGKNYNFDCNVTVKGNEPPLFPEIEECIDDEIIEEKWRVSSYYFTN